MSNHSNLLFVNRYLLRLYGRLLGDDQRHDQVDQRDPAEAGEERQQGQQADDGRVDAEVLAQACAHARDHAVGGTAGQLFVFGVHVYAPFK